MGHFMVHTLCIYQSWSGLKGSLHESTPIVKRVSVENFLSPVKIGPKMAVFRQLRGVNIDFCFLTPKRHIVWRITCKNRFWGFGCGALEGWKKKPSKHFWRVISRIWGNETPEGIMTKFCMWIDIQDLITCATFGLDRIRGSGVARGRIFRFLIDLRRRPYNTLALPCECVVQASSLFTTTLWCQYSLVTASTQWMQSRFLTILLSC